MCMYIYIYIYICMCIYIYIYIYIYVCHPSKGFAHRTLHSRQTDRLVHACARTDARRGFSQPYPLKGLARGTPRTPGLR